MKYNKSIITASILLSMFGLQIYAENKQQITVVNNYGSDISLELKWRMRPKPHTQRLEDKSLTKGKTDTYKSPISTYKLLELTAWPTKGINASMKGRQKAHGNTYFVINKGSRYKLDAGEKRRHFVIDGYENKAAYDAAVAAKKAADDKKIADAKNLISSCADGSVALCDDGTDIATLKCATGQPDLNGMCPDGTLVTCVSNTNPTCDDFSVPVKINAPVAPTSNSATPTGTPSTSAAK